MKGTLEVYEDSWANGSQCFRAVIKTEGFRVVEFADTAEIAIEKAKKAVNSQMGAPIISQEIEL